MSLIIVAIKLSQSLDGIERIPRHPIEPAALAINWEHWRKSHEGENDKENGNGTGNDNEKVEGLGLKKGNEMSVVEGDVFKMSGEEMDRYMDWYEAMFVADAEPKGIFPLSTYDCVR